MASDASMTPNNKMQPKASPASSTSLDDKHCRLLEVPAELRNRIYRLTLQHHKPITVTEKGLDVPGILKTCRQIRSEAQAIYICENKFAIEGESWDSTGFTKFTQSVKLMGIKPKKTKVLGEWRNGKPSWSNLILWLRRWHQREVQWRPSSPKQLLEHGEDDEVEYAAGALCEVVEHSRDLPWDRVEKLLDRMRPMLINLDSAWEED